MESSRAKLDSLKRAHTRYQLCKKNWAAAWSVFIKEKKVPSITYRGSMEYPRGWLHYEATCDLTEWSGVKGLKMKLSHV